MPRPFIFSRRHFLEGTLGLLGVVSFAPLRRAFAGAWTRPRADTGTHLVVMTVADKDHVWHAQAYVGDDPTAAAKVVRFKDASGKPHRGLEAWFYADCVEAGATRLDNAYDYINCTSVRVAYDDIDVPVPKSSKADGTFDFWRGCRCPAIRYGKQVGWDASKIDWTLLPSYAHVPQEPWDDSKRDYSFNGFGNCTTRTMGQGGARADIGYMSVWNMAFITNPNDETWAVIRRTEDHIGGWRMVYTSDPQTGHIVDIHKYPGTTILPQAQVSAYRNNALAPYGGSYDGDTLIPVKDGPHSWYASASPMIPNGAHLTSYALLAAMITGTARDRDHASFWSNFPLLETGPQYTAAGGVADNVSQRRFAWCLRNLFMASYISSDTAYFAAETARNLPIAMAHATNPFGAYDTGASYPRNNTAGGYRGMAPWQQYYLMTTIDAVWHKLPDWKPFAEFLAKFIATWYRYPFSLVQTVYYLLVHNPDGSDMTDFPMMVNMSLANHGFTQTEADAITHAQSVQEAFNVVHAHGNANGKVWDGKCVNGVADFMGYLHSADSYPAMAGAAIVCAANTGAPGTAKALAYWQALPTKPDFRRNGKFNFAPRGH